MPYYDGTRSLSDDLNACVSARKESYAQFSKAAHNRHLEESYKRVGSSAADRYGVRAVMFEHQEVALTLAADQCSKRAYDALVTGDIEYDERDAKRAV